jgi:hypothetical protein
VHAIRQQLRQFDQLRDTTWVGDYATVLARRG